MKPSLNFNKDKPKDLDIENINGTDTPFTFRTPASKENSKPNTPLGGGFKKSSTSMDRKLMKRTTFARLIDNQETFDDQDNMEQGKASKSEFHKLQIAEMSVSTSSLVSIVISVLAYDLEYEERDPILLRNLLYASFSVSILTIFLNFIRHLQKIRLLKARKHILNHVTIFARHNIKYVILETLIMLIQPYPWIANIKVEVIEFVENVTIYYNINDFFYVLIMIRLYLIVRTILNFTWYSSPRAGRVASFYGAQGNYQYAVKCLMKKYPFLILFVFFFASILVFAHMLRICERPLANSSAALMRLSDYWNCMWCVIISMATVGYGDFYSKTFLGRTVSFTFCIWGVFISSILIVNLTHSLDLDSAEEKSFYLLNKLDLRKKMKNLASKVITNLFRIAMNNKRKARGNSKKLSKINISLISAMRTDLKEFRLIARQIKVLSDNVNPKEEIMTELDYVKKDLQLMKKKQDYKHESLVESVQQMVEVFHSAFSAKSMNRLPDDRSRVLTLPIPWN